MGSRKCENSTGLWPLRSRAAVHISKQRHTDSTLFSGPHIQPIPPPLEFPFPRNSDEISTSPTATLPTTDTSPYEHSIGLPTHQNTLKEGHDAASISRPALAERRFPPDGPLRASSEAQQPHRPINARPATGKLGTRNKSGKQDNAIQKGKPTSNGDPYRKFAVGNDNYKTKGVGVSGTFFSSFLVRATILEIRAKICLDDFAQASK